MHTDLFTALPRYKNKINPEGLFVRGCTHLLKTYSHGFILFTEAQDTPRLNLQVPLRFL